MAKKEVYLVKKDFSSKDLSKELKMYLESKFSLEVQVIENGDLIVVQAREKPGVTLKKIVGMAMAITVTLNLPDSKHLAVEVGNGKWADKVISGGLLMFLTPWFLVPATIGAVKQGRMPEQILDFISNYVKFKSWEYY